MRQLYDHMVKPTRNPSDKPGALEKEIQELKEDISELSSGTGESQLLGAKIERLKELTAQHRTLQR